MSEAAPAAAPTSAPATSTPTSTPSTTGTSPTSTSAPSRPAMTSAQMRERLMTGTFEAGGNEPDAPDAPDPAMPDLAELGIDHETDTAPEPEIDLSDDPFAAYRDADIHGLKALDILKSIQEGKLPDGLLDKLRVSLKDGDETWEDTIAGARNGAQMQRKFTQRMQEVANERRAAAEERAAWQQEQQQFTAERDDLVEFLRSWKEDPAKLRAGLIKLGMPFEKAAILHAEEYGQIQSARQLEAEGKLPQGTADRMIRSMQVEAELEGARLAQQRMEARQQSEAARQQAEAAKQREAAAQTTVEKTAKDIANAAVKVFDQLGVRRGTGEWNYFRQALQSVWAPGQAAPSPAEIEAAVRETKKWSDAERAAAQENKPAPAVKLGKTSLDGGAPSRPSPGAAPKSLTSAQARAKYLR